MGKVMAICVSEKRGTEKKRVDSCYFDKEWGLQGDAHGGAWHRQVSLLGSDKIDAFNKKGANVEPGAFGENLIVEGFDFRLLPVGTLLRCGSVLLEITQIGKECHTHCAIYNRVGDCIMPREGVFAQVLQSGYVSVGDEMEIEVRLTARPWQCAVITLSDRSAKGVRADESGPLLCAQLKEKGYCVVEEIIIPDEAEALKKELIRLCDQRQLDLILTTGGTGFAPRDITPEATLAVAERNAPGIAEAIRKSSMKITPKAMLSRGVSVIRGKTLIINLPGSPKACKESIDVFIDVIPHGLELLRGQSSDCGNSRIVHTHSSRNNINDSY